MFEKSAEAMPTNAAGCTLLGHRPNPGFGPIDVSRTPHLIGARVDLLLGTDILAQSPFLLDWQNGCATFSREEIPFHGRRLLTTTRFGVPCLEFALAVAPILRVRGLNPAVPGIVGNRRLSSS
jgi:hypothetical protein